MSNIQHPKDLTGKPVNPGDWIVYHETVKDYQTRLGLVLHKFSHDRYLVWRTFIRGSWWNSNWSFDTPNLNQCFAISNPLKQEEAYKELAKALNAKKLSKILTDNLTPPDLQALQAKWGIYV